MNRVLPVSLLALALAGCDASGTLSEIAVGTDGGIIRTGDGLAELIVPPGALSEDVEITITPWQGDSPVAAVAPTWDFQPDGLVFEQPATMRIALDADVDPTTVEATLGWLEGNEFFAIDGETTVTEDGYVEGLVTHFTPYTVVGTTDADGDGYSVAGGDCDDTNAAVYPGAVEVCDGIDNDCDGLLPQGELDVNGNGTPDCADVPIDADGDGYFTMGNPGQPADCDDNDPQTYPGAPELCDGLDNDCDGLVPSAEGDLNGNGVLDCNEGIVDNDGDGYAAPNGVFGSDCDDNNPTIYPGAPEQCDGLDNDCDGIVPTDEVDANGNGILDCNESPFTCFNGIDDDGDGWIDMDDPGCANPQSGQESDGVGGNYACNDGVDNDLDGLIDADDADCVDGWDDSE